jgi:hypothetical protein
MGKEIDDQYSDEETKRRFEAALRGAREVGHEPMKDISPKRKAKAGAKANPPKKHGLPKKVTAD